MYVAIDAIAIVRDAALLWRAGQQYCQGRHAKFPPPTTALGSRPQPYPASRVSPSAAAAASDMAQGVRVVGFVQGTMNAVVVSCALGRGVQRSLHHSIQSCHLSLNPPGRRYARPPPRSCVPVYNAIPCPCSSLDRGPRRFCLYVFSRLHEPPPRRGRSEQRCARKRLDRRRRCDGRSKHALSPCRSWRRRRRVARAIVAAGRQIGEIYGAKFFIWVFCRRRRRWRRVAPALVRAGRPRRDAKCLFGVSLRRWRWGWRGRAALAPR